MVSGHLGPAVPQLVAWAHAHERETAQVPALYSWMPVLIQRAAT